MKRWLLVAALAALCDITGAQQAPSVQRFFDVSPMTRGFPTFDFDARLPLASVYQQQNDECPEFDEYLSADLLADVIRSTVFPPSWEEEHRGIGAWGRHLIVRNEANALDSVGRLLAYIEASCVRRATVVVYGLASSAAPDGSRCILDASETRRLLDSAKPRLLARTRITDGPLTRFRSGDLVTFVADYDVEVAQDARIADPRIKVLEAGLDLRLKSSALPSGDRLIQLTARSSRLDQLRERSTESAWVGKLQLPSLDVHVVASSGVVPAGGAILVGMAARSEDQLFLVQVTPDPIPAGPLKEFSVISKGASGVRNLRLGKMFLGGPFASGRGESPEGNGEESIVLERDALMEMIRSNVASQEWDDQPNWSLFDTPTAILARSNAEVGSKVHEFVERISQDILKTVGLEIRLGKLTSDQATLAASPEADLATIAGLLETRGYAAASGGDTFRLMLGQESAYLMDHDVEIAQEAMIADPIVATWFRGVALQGTLVRSPRGGVCLSAEFVGQDPVREVASFDGNANDVGTVDTPRVTTAGSRMEETLENGRWTVLRLASVPGQDGVSAVLARARF